LKTVVDTSAWIEWLVDGPVRAQLAAQMPLRDDCLVPTIVQLELAKWLARERNEEVADELIAYTQKCHVVPLDTGLALLAADLARQHRLATADAIVYAVAVAADAALLTCDAHFSGLPGVILVVKSAS
jgi:predicted nucleic acid-binding protein